MTKKTQIMIGLTAILGFLPLSTWSAGGDGLGQIIKIRTNLHTFVGKPAWLLIIRDIDHNQNIPYLYDFTTGTNYWMALTYGRNYVITVSEMTFNPYGRKISNFCHLQSMGAIQRGVSMDIHITGDLSPRTNTFACHVTKYNEPGFNIETQDE